MPINLSLCVNFGGFGRTMIEFMHCCCGGIESSQNGGEEEHLFPLNSPVLTCRDTIFQHPRTHACDLLSQLPYSIPIDSGYVYKYIYIYSFFLAFMKEINFL